MGSLWTLRPKREHLENISALCLAAAMLQTPANDNAHLHLVPIIGFITGDGEVTITDPAWRPAPTPAAGEVLLFPSDPREA